MSDPLDPDPGQRGENVSQQPNSGGDSGSTRSQSGRDPMSPTGQSAGPPSRSDHGSSNEGLRDSDAAQFVFDVLSSVLVVGMIGVFLFVASGVWPPLVAVESGSMEPHIQQGDLVFVMEADRFAGPGAHAATGVVTAREGRKTGYRMFQGYGDVIVYQPNGDRNATPIIHRAMFWVEKGENWYDMAKPAYRGNADNCRELQYCPAPHAGFITKGDHNDYYDQVLGGITSPVKPHWVVGTAEVRVPLLGQIRLASGNPIGSVAG